ncbi:molybdopterin molybdotransferase MoeA [Guyparkeria hydrothermalis]|uniref:molybdopterin molybdotransferase MoeA n=1 Tax=Guyparkeria TaxID=2035712 RepID=UPI0010AD9A55|nr:MULTISPECIES: molybdopterin molybdotransferase MoeA [Guyparkeria]MCL7750295.1 molybdopterin molybdotransferase MoeA [Guyparkeria hydrothermalis]TKA88729.1 molybdopterin molybdotransferase MoeA [Guyparkeria sp. SB14A]
MTNCHCGTSSPSAAEAIMTLSAAAPALSELELPLDQALGRVLARTIHAPQAYPPFNRAMMDGYAARLADVTCGGELTIRTGSQACLTMPESLHSGQCVPIATGAPLPPGADVVLRREIVAVSAGKLRATAQVKRWADCEGVGAINMPGATVLSVGIRLQPGHLSLAARHGLATLPIRRPPRVAVLVTGDELVSPDQPCSPGGIHDSNSILLETTLVRFGADVIGPFGPIADHLPTIEAEVRRHLASADLVLLVGGSSVGVHDFGRTVLRRLGTPLFEGVSMRPGRPTSAARSIGGTILMSLPGRPTALLTALHGVVQPALYEMMTDGVSPPRVTARLAQSLESASVDRYVPIQLDSREGTWWARSESIDPEEAAALAMIPARMSLKTGACVSVLIMNCVSDR